jgi:hypothetical protein
MLIERDGGLVYEIEEIKTNRQVAKSEVLRGYAKKLLLNGETETTTNTQIVLVVSAKTWKDEPIPDFLPVQVYVNGEYVGDNDDGTIEITFEEPGTYVVEVRKGMFDPAQIEVKVI